MMRTRFSLRRHATRGRSLVAALLAVVGAAASQVHGTAAQQAATPAPVPPRLRLKSPAFVEASVIPKPFTCRAESGTGVSPPFQFSNVPNGTASFVLTLNNMDNHPAKGIDDEVFWVLWNVPGSATGLAQGVPKGGELPNGSRQTDFGRGNVGYRPPCPPPGTGPLHYVFNLYALDQMLSVPAGATSAEVMNALDGHILGSTILLGYFER